MLHGRRRSLKVACKGDSCNAVFDLVLRHPAGATAPEVLAVDVNFVSGRCPEAPERPPEGLGGRAGGLRSSRGLGRKT